MFELIEKQGLRVIDELANLVVDSNPLVLPPHYSLHVYFEEVKLEGRKHLFHSLRKVGSTTKSKKGSPDAAYLKMAAKRLVYKYGSSPSLKSVFDILISMTQSIVLYTTYIFCI